jgi:hypothetical protein
VICWKIPELHNNKLNGKKGIEIVGKDEMGIIIMHKRIN